MANATFPAGTFSIDVVGECGTVDVLTGRRTAKLTNLRPGVYAITPSPAPGRLDCRNDSNFHRFEPQITIVKPGGVHTVSFTDWKSGPQQVDEASCQTASDSEELEAEIKLADEILDSFFLL